MVTVPVKDTKKLALRLLTTLTQDRDNHLLRIDNYLQGTQDDPYMPENADAEYKLLAERAVTNVMPFIVGTPAQAMYVDKFRRGLSDVDSDGTGKSLAVQTSITSPEWDHWQKSRLDGRQHAIYRGALAYGHAFTVTEKSANGVRTKGLSALRTAALYEDAANDDAPVAALHVKRWADNQGETKVRGVARMWDDTNEYEVTFDSPTDVDDYRIKKIGKHGAKECPVTRFAAAVDLEGRTCGVIEPMIPLQNRINQTVFDLLIVQSFASFKVKTISGMAPPIKMKPINEAGEEITVSELEAGIEPDAWVPRLGPDGRPIPDAVNLNARRVFWAKDHEARFGTLDETPLDGFISAIELAFRHMAALSQTPPHHILGEIANLSAEALDAAETALSRKVEEFKAGFGESWERVFRIAAQIGQFDGADDFHGEAIWRNLDGHPLSAVGDALAKLREIGVPERGLWSRVPGTTANELAEWERLADEEKDTNTQSSLRRASVVPTFREPTAPAA